MKINTVSKYVASLNKLKQIVSFADSPFPENPDECVKVKSLGGSTGAILVKDKKGNLFVKKTGAHAEHIQNEYEIESYLRHIGINIPPSRLYETPSGPVKLSRFIPGKILSNFDPKQIAPKIKSNFLAHALVGNWDVIGLSKDNIIIDEQGEPWYVDVGGSGPWRAQGKPKSELWNESPDQDIANMKHYNPLFFKDLTDDELRSQYSDIQSKHQNAVQALKDKKLIDILNKRFKNMHNNYAKNVLSSKKASMVQPSPEDPNLLGRKLDKYLKGGKKWTLSELTPEQQKALYDVHSRSYAEKGHIVYPFEKWLQYARGGRSPWEFIGDNEQTGYVTVKKIPGLPMEIYKMTAAAGSKKGKLSGMANILHSDKPVFGAVTEDIYEMAIRMGFQTLSVEEIKLLMQLSSGLFGDVSGSPELNELGQVTLNHRVGGQVTKQIICNDVFKNFINNFKNMKMF